MLLGRVCHGVGFGEQEGLLIPQTHLLKTDLMLIETIQKPNNLAIVKVEAHMGWSDYAGIGNSIADEEVKLAASRCNTHAFYF